MPTLLQRLDETQLPLASLTTRHVSLEDVFVHLTGRRLRDEESNS
jgi:ABC-2 type transport system ATP-binding protein